MNERQEIVSINGKDLTLKDVVAVAKKNARVEVEEEVKKRLSAIRDDFDAYLEEIFKWDDENKPPEKDKNKSLEENTAAYERYQLKRKQKMMYGVTTGFGKHKTHAIEMENVERLQLNLVRSHACGAGDDFNPETTRAIMTLRINTLASGYCGISPKVVEQLEKFIKLDIRPCIPEQGSVGASGDLAPLAHLALGLIGEGPVRYRKAKELLDDLQKLTEKHPDLEIGPDSRFSTLVDLKKAHPELDINLKLKLAAKDGLALINGLAVTTAIGVLAHADAENLLEWADVIGAVTLESLIGSSRAFDEVVLSAPVYHHLGAGKSAMRVRGMIKGSKLINRSDHVHDAYSLRCIPQVHGAVRDALTYVQTTLQNHLNSVDDDPIILSEEEMNKPRESPLDCTEPPEGTDKTEWMKRRHFEHGNFHGEPIAFAMDLLAIVVAELGNISERRTQMLLDENHNRGLPSCLVDNPDGVNSGYMIAQYTAAALVSENKVLCHPASVDSIPTSANSEDHVSMGTIAARKARKVVENVRNILAIELLCATEALSFRLGDQLITDPDSEKKTKVRFTGECGAETRTLYDRVRNELMRIRSSEVDDRRDGGEEDDAKEGDKVHIYKLIGRAREFLNEPPRVGR